MGRFKQTKKVKRTPKCLVMTVDSNDYCYHYDIYVYLHLCKSWVEKCRTWSQSKLCIHVEMTGMKTKMSFHVCYILILVIPSGQQLLKNLFKLVTKGFLT